MEYNPYAVRYEALGKRIAELGEEESRLRQEMSWYSDFDVETCHSNMTAAERILKKLTEDLARTEAELSTINREIMNLEILARPGFDPRYWLSSERSNNKKQLERQKQLLAYQESEKHNLRTEFQAKQDYHNKKQVELNRYKNFDPLAAEAKASALRIESLQLTGEKNDVLPMMEELHNQLVEPLAELEQCQYERQVLLTRLQRAERYERKLNDAPNGYERKLIHEECENELGDAKPSKVIRRIKSEIESIDRTVDKLDKRLRVISRRGTRCIRSIVIDGKNLCHMQSKFIGLPALKAVAKRLSEQYSLTIVFDASIRSDLKMDDQSIRASFDNTVTVHVVATKIKADETILDAAADPGAYVISNDRFRDYPEKDVVSNKRLIRFEILNGRVLIHDLNVNEAFATVA